MLGGVISIGESFFALCLKAAERRENEGSRNRGPSAAVLRAEQSGWIELDRCVLKGCSPLLSAHIVSGKLVVAQLAASLTQSSQQRNNLCVQSDRRGK